MVHSYDQSEEGVLETVLQWPASPSGHFILWYRASPYQRNRKMYIIYSLSIAYCLVVCSAALSISVTMLFEQRFVGYLFARRAC